MSTINFCGGLFSVEYNCSVSSSLLKNPKSEKTASDAEGASPMPPARGIAHTRTIRRAREAEGRAELKALPRELALTPWAHCHEEAQLEGSGAAAAKEGTPMRLPATLQRDWPQGL